MPLRNCSLTQSLWSTPILYPSRRSRKQLIFPISSRIG